jgi:hypothetical protein
MRRLVLKTGIRTLALALIIFPEPVTTALGIMILGASLAVGRPKSLKKFGDLDGLLRRSLTNNQLVGFRRCYGFEKTVNHRIKLDVPSALQSVLEKSKQSPPLPGYNSWFDNRKLSESVMYHTLKTSFPQYEADPDDKRAGLKKSNIVVEHHKLKLIPVPWITTGTPQFPSI